MVSFDYDESIEDLEILFRNYKYKSFMFITYNNIEYFMNIKNLSYKQVY